MASPIPPRALAGDARLVVELVELGPFFAVDLHAANSVPTAPWRAMSELASDGGALDRRIRQVQAGLATMAAVPRDEIELRVAASVAQLGLAARLVSPVVALAVRSGQLLDVALSGSTGSGGVRWRPELGGAFPLSVAASAAGPTYETIDELVAALGENLLSRALLPLIEGTRAVVSVSPTVLWGNVASAVNSAVTLIARRHPEQAARSVAIGNILLRLRGFPPDGAEPAKPGEVSQVGQGFRRRSCCLIYRLAPRSRASYCGDCVLLG
ncbi:MAG: hypothetical protein JWN95_1214 [Frankiales bacterium]|nr:hypothetical protein [Frankiales bacterium]